MSQRTDRRNFLRTAAVASTGVLGGLTAAALPTGAAANEPITRNGTAKFKFSLAAYSYRSLLRGVRGASAELTLSDFIDDCAKFGLEGTELTSYYFPTDLTHDYLRQLKRQSFRLGLDISGTAVGNDFCHPPGPKRDEQIALVKRWVDYAEILGAPVIRIFSGNVKDGMTPDEAHRLAVAAIEECCHYAGQHGVHLALENHGGLTTRVDGLLALVDAVKSPWFGLNFDSGNFHTDDPYGDLAKIAPYSVNVQIKVVVSGPDRKKRPSDFARLAQMLKGAGYRGYIVLEFEESGDPRTECPKYLDQLREAFA